MNDEPAASRAPAQQRLFFALFLPEAAAGALHRQAVPLLSGGARLMRADTLHLTLAFLGPRPAEEVASLAAAAAAIRVGCPAIDLRFDRFGYWAHNKIVWAGCSQPPDALGDLAAQLADALRARGYVLDRRPYVPHVTLLRRCASPPAAEHKPDVTCTLREFQLVVSQTTPAGARYAAVRRWPLS